MLFGAIVCITVNQDNRKKRNEEKKHQKNFKQLNVSLINAAHILIKLKSMAARGTPDLLHSE